MSVKDKVIKVRYCDKCQKEITGKLKTVVCPGCGDEFCYSCIKAANKPKVEKAKRGRPKKENQTQEKTSITLQGITWEGKTRQETVAGFYAQNGPDVVVTPEEQRQIEEYLAGGK
jgi:ribosome-binding protein aMBF1 (putative translation factor)